MFLQDHKAHLDPTTAYNLLSSHGRMDELLYFAELLGDFERVITHYIQVCDYKRALETLQKNAEETKRGAGQYFTPRVLIELLVRLMQPQPGERVLRGTVADIADAVEAAGLRQAAVILLGRALAGEPDPDAGESHLYDPARDRSAKRAEGLR